MKDKDKFRCRVCSAEYPVGLDTEYAIVQHGYNYVRKPLCVFCNNSLYNNALNYEEFYEEVKRRKKEEEIRLVLSIVLPENTYNVYINSDREIVVQCRLLLKSEEQIEVIANCWLPLLEEEGLRCCQFYPETMSFIVER